MSSRGTARSVQLDISLEVRWRPTYKDTQRGLRPPSQKLPSLYLDRGKYMLGQTGGSIPPKLEAAVRVLLDAHVYAEDTQSDVWQFAVEISQVRELGANDTDLRWLVRKGMVEHAQEVTVLGDDGRAFHRTGALTFTDRTCLILTERGVALLRASMPSPAQSKDEFLASDNGEGNADHVVNWDSELRKLNVNGQLVKRFKWPAENQEAILNAFQEEGWPERIDDPLPPHPEQDSKRRLSDTIKCLNRKQVNGLIHFRGDGTGEGVVWELVTPDFKFNSTR